jgi:hypothetical protein
MQRGQTHLTGGRPYGRDALGAVRVLGGPRVDVVIATSPRVIAIAPASTRTLLPGSRPPPVSLGLIMRLRIVARENHDRQMLQA